MLVSTALAVALYLRGVRRARLAGRYLRHLAYFAGIGVSYAALQTALSYYASHMFFVLQLQHFLLHDLGPALLAAAAPGEALWYGLPRWVRRCPEDALRRLRMLREVLLDARVATLLYIVSQLLWILPPIAFDVMLSNPLYELMSWSTMLGALPFWHLVLDPRPYPLARLRLRQRFFILYLAMLPMTLTSAALAFSQTNWYPVYAVCGRFLPISPLMDQELGGTAMWVPGAMLFGIVLFLFLARRLDQAPLTSSLGGTSRGHGDPSRGTAAGPAWANRVSRTGHG